VDNEEVGKVHDLIVDTISLRTRYLDVRLAKNVAGADEDRDVLIPIGTARIDDEGDRVIVRDLATERIALLPAYNHGHLSRDDETKLREYFSAGEAASAGTIGAGAVAGRDFYDHALFDDRQFFARRTAPADAATPDQSRTELNPVDAARAEAARVDAARASETSVPVTREENVADQRLAPSEEIIARKSASREEHPERHP